MLTKSFLLATVGLYIWIIDAHSHAVMYKGKVGDKKMELLEAKIFSLASRDKEYNLKDGLEIAMSMGTLLDQGK